MHRKIISLTTTFSAILILLLHAVVPHHSHGDQLCLNACHLSHEVCCHEHEHEHEHDNEKLDPHRVGCLPQQHGHHSSDCCEIAEKIVFLIVSQRYPAICAMAEEATQEHDTNTDTPLLQSTLFLKPPGSQFVKRKQKQILTYDDMTACHQQLRAPPAC